MVDSNTNISARGNKREITTINTVNLKQKSYELDIKTFPKCSSVGMAQGRIQKPRNKKMAYTYHNDAITSAHNTIHHLYCTSHGIVTISASYFLVSRLFGASLAITTLEHFENVFI